MVMQTRPSLFIRCQIAQMQDEGTRVPSGSPAEPGPAVGQRRTFATAYSDSDSESEQEPTRKKLAPDLAAPAPSSINILAQLELSLQREQAEHTDPQVAGAERGDSDWGEDEALQQRSKEDLIAEIKALRAQLAQSACETRRLRQCLTVFRVLPKAVRNFTRLVDRAESLLQAPGPGGLDQPSGDPSTLGDAPMYPSPSSLSSASASSSSSPLSTPGSPSAHNRKWENPSDWNPAQLAPFSQIKIEKWQIERFNKSTPQKFVNDLMQSLYTTEFMATHSVTGARSSSSKYRETKPAMDRAEVQAILDVTKHFFPDMTDTLIRRMMGQKLNNCTKKFAASKVKTELYPLINYPVSQIIK
nr:PREDICTED: BEN domain-containing protein 6 isoform X1 [Lepisosteus oculatus]